ncbi:MAG TPA: hypothetical protein VIH89_03915 [Candidatus Sulfotelmatobacter sp.]|jgi:hypothetical protein
MSDQLRPTENLLYPEWQPQVQAALLEFDLAKLPERIKAAEIAISTRLKAITLYQDHHSERVAISDALATLNFLKRECVHLRDAQQK